MIKRSSLLGATGLLAGGIIGAGIFSLPYVVAQSGLILGTGVLLIATLAYCAIHLMYADVILGEQRERRFVGYAREYLGVLMSYVAILMVVVEMVFVMTIYLILSFSFVQLFIPQFGATGSLLLFWVIASAGIFIDRKRFAGVEVLASFGIIGVIGILFFAGIPRLPMLAGFPLFSGGGVLLPLAAILFALSGRVAIPSIVEYVRGRGASPRSLGIIKRAILYGTWIPAVVYCLFILSILVLSGSVSTDAVSGIVGLIPGWLSALVGLLGLLSLWSSYILVGLDVSNTLRYDLDVPAWLRFCIVVIVPLAIYAAGFRSFIGMISLVGGIFLAFEGIFILLIWSAARSRGKLGGIINPPKAVLFGLWIVFCSALIGVLVS